MFDQLRRTGALEGSGRELPSGDSQHRPAWFSSDEQYESFLKMTEHDIGPQCITATSINVEHLNEQHRKQLLAAHALRPNLEYICTIFAQHDDAALSSRTGTFEKQLARRLTGDLAAKVSGALKRGNVLIPPPAMTQLIREVVEWCTYTDGEAERRSLGINDVIHLLLSINGDQERQDHPDFFQSWPPTEEELAQYNDAMAGDDDMVLRELRRNVVSELARMQANTIAVPDVVLGDTYDTWFKTWPESAPHDLIGDTPEDAFRASTGMSLRAFIKLGLRLWEVTKSGEVGFSASSIGVSVDSQAMEVMLGKVSLPVKEYRARLKRERRRGSLAHRRYTFTERPLLRFGDDDYLALRPAWILDRLCGSQLYWQTFFDFGTENEPPGEQFSQAMNYVFEASVGYLFRRVTRRARPKITLIAEDEMQQAWTRKGSTPSVCDWVLVSGRYCLLVDATNHWLDAKAAQGFADAEDYHSDVERTFLNKKFLQLKSTIELLAEKGWEGCTFDEQTVYVPLVIVPNAGIPPTVLSDFDFKLRSHAVLGTLGKFVTSPGILICNELQVFEGVSEHRAPQSFVEMLGQWRVLCTQSMPVRPQTFLDLARLDRPMGKYPKVARSLLMQKL